MPRKNMKIESASVPVPIPAPTPAPSPEASIVGKPKKQNNWIDHVKATATKDGISYRQALSVAKTTYKKD